jgi:hypothetical protein
MSLQTCKRGDTEGFPLKLSQDIAQAWPASTNGSTESAVNAQLKKLMSPTDFSVSWGPPTQSASISVTSTSSKCQVRGFDTVSDSTSLIYGNATYKCSSVMSIVKIQHGSLASRSSSNYEVILAFQIISKSDNPSSPDIILITRPLIFGSINTSPFWASVNTAMVRETPQNCAVDLSTLFAKNSSEMLPMIAYQTCLPVKLLNYKSSPFTLASLNIRVNVILTPIYVVADDTGIGKCTSVTRYTLITEPRNPVNLFDGVSANTKLQFKDGLGPGGFPVGITTNLIPLAPSSTISSFERVLDTFMIIVPEDYLGKSLSELSEVNTAAPAPKKKKALKCYRIDSEKDIKDGTILVDPSTGESLQTILDQEGLYSSGVSSGLMPGDVQDIIFVIMTTLLSIGLFGYLVYIFNMLTTGQEYAYHNLAVFVALLAFLISFGVIFGK